MLTPARRRGVELLDDPSVPDALRRRSIADVARANRLLGGARALARALDGVATRLPSDVTILDVGTGAGDLARLARRRLHGRRTYVIGVDVSPVLVTAARRNEATDDGVVGDALHLPFAPRSIDLVLCSQLLHHFEDADARRLVTELDRVSRGVVIIADLRRSGIAAAGFWLVSWLLGFHAVTRHDGVVSVLRGFTRSELADLVRQATGRSPSVERRLGWRLTAVWRVGETDAGL